MPILHQINDHTLVDFQDVAAVLEYEYNLRLYYCCIVRPAGIGPFVIPLSESEARNMIADMKLASDENKPKCDPNSITQESREELLSGVQHELKK